MMDFDSEPWDATCEAAGQGTADTGLNLPQWDLNKGDYFLRLYPREDGTALDAVAIVAPGGDAPNAVRLARGDSTLCPANEAPAASIAASAAHGLGFSDVTLIVLAIGLVAYGILAARRRMVGSGLVARSSSRGSHPFVRSGTDGSTSGLPRVPPLEVALHPPVVSSISGKSKIVEPN